MEQLASVKFDPFEEDDVDPTETKLDELEDQLNRTLRYLDVQLNNIEEYEERVRDAQRAANRVSFPATIYESKKLMTDAKLMAIKSLTLIVLDRKKEEMGSGKEVKDIISFFNSKKNA